VTTEEKYRMGPHWTDSTLQLSEVPLSPNGKVPRQAQFSLGHGWHGLMSLGVSHSIRLCLYRPGFQLVEIHAWEDLDTASWQVAADLRAQKKALDDLISRSRDVPPDRTERIVFDSETSRLAPGSVSEPHKNALLFLASEYDRLSACAPPGCAELYDLGERLKKTAAELNDLARH
jgi:hypothetical protein